MAEQPRPPAGAGRPPIEGLPAWWEPLRTRAATAVAADFTRLRTPAQGGRPSAVLVLLAEHAGAPEVLLVQRAPSMRTHAGQVAFPGGAQEETDHDASATALREAYEETGVVPESVTVVAELPRLWIPVSGFVVTPVLAWWHAPHPVYPRDRTEVASVTRLSVAALAEPANRLRVRHPSGHVGPAFTVEGLVVWGFTGGVLATLLEFGGWARPWPHDRVADLPELTTGPVP